jgi:hypothetical protein
MLFTPETARLAIVKSQAARKANRQRDRERLALATKALELILETAAESPVQTPPISPPTDEFIQRRLARVREQLVRLDGMLSEATDSKVIKELSEALSRLQDQEQKLAGRPGPGTLKPKSPDGPSSKSTPRALPIPRLPAATPAAPTPAAQAPPQAEQPSPGAQDQEQPEPPAPTWRSEPPDF